MQILDDSGVPVGIRMLKPMDTHQHLRMGPIMGRVAKMVGKRFASAVIMSNFDPPLITAKQISHYQHDIIEGAGNFPFVPLMTLFMTKDLLPTEIYKAAESDSFVGVKYMPRGASTKSYLSISSSAMLWTPGTRAYEVLRALIECEKIFLVHGAEAFNLAGEELDHWDQEPYYFREVAPRIRDAHPKLKISNEHLSTAFGAEYMRKHGGPLHGCGITAHHLLLDRRDMMRDGFRPDRFWWPVLGRKEDRDEIRALVKEGHSFVYLGSDSAPHPITAKRSDCCSGGVLMAHAGIELYVEAFEAMGILEKLEQFASINGPAFYSMSQSTQSIVLDKKPWTVPPLLVSGAYGFSDAEVVPFRLGDKVLWKLYEE